MAGMDKNLNELLKWGIENSAAPDPSAPETSGPKTSLNAEALAAIMGAPSDAELMQASMAAITSKDPEMTLESKLTAFDNLEQLVESLDNANLLSRLGLWTPLLELLGHEEDQLRLMAAWCVGTAVQNNAPSQERLVALGGVEKLVAMALGERLPMEKRAGDGEETTGEAVAAANTNGGAAKDVRRKAIYALSSAVRNYQPALDVAAKELRKRGEDVQEGMDATDMDALNELMNGLKNKALNA
ncbi:Fes1-domain-containing protein [Annulohypoxylon maeteangense]|uniref:Fes1-domain-containing protein n=1 Tax=Annulohypoxylon maeteangense TaxID=1927788 RepID=UPI002008C42F|nr:Fes1-domain-containing protein [Annulohypoxylon maeteangense]KAI0884475.1 Fes1-domain-containing protein [Annulohypoxylon maeteangense]